MFIFWVFGNPPEDFAKDLPLGCVAHVEWKIFRVGRDEEVRTCEALKASDLEPEIAVRYDDESLMKVFTLNRRRVDEDD